MNTFTTNRIEYRGIQIEDGLSCGQRFYVVKNEYFDSLEEAQEYIDDNLKEDEWNG